MKLLHKDLTDLLIRNLGLTFKDFIEKIRARVLFYYIKDKKYNTKRFYEMIDEIFKIILGMIKWSFFPGNDYRKYQLICDTLQLNGIKSKHLSENINIIDFIITSDFVENHY